MKAAFARFGKNDDHVFDLDAEPEPVGDTMDTGGGGEVIDDGFGPIGDDYDDDNESGSSVNFLHFLSYE